MRARIIDCIRRTYDITDPFKVQVLCPALEGVNGVNSLNSELQATLNPSTAHGYIQYGATQFRINDKVIMKRNNYDLGYYNGDVGIVSSVIDGTASVRIRGESFDITRDLLADMSLAYAMTIHKSQGSEFQSVVVVLPEKPENMLVRNLFYTGITRAKKEVLVVSQGQAMNRAISRNRNGKRRTILLDELMK
jgi:exodeoxyribonuclease V alpha subunit